MVYPHSVPPPALETVRRKRGRPRKYGTPEQAAAAKRMSSAASTSVKKDGGGGVGGGGSASAGKKALLGSLGMLFYKSFVYVCVLCVCVCSWIVFSEWLMGFLWFYLIREIWMFRN